MTTILGLSALYHDSAAVVLQDGTILAAAQEERFTRRKYDARFPEHAIRYCLDESGIDPEEIDYVAFYEQPLTKFERLIETYIAHAPAGFASFRQAIPLWLRQKLHTPREIRRGLDGRFRGRIVYPSHHESHAASAFFPSPFDEAAILTLDGVGEWSTTTIGFGRDHRIELLEEIRFPHSVGLLYSAFTSYCGFKVNGGEYKLMGLAPYGEPRYVDRILDHLIDLKPDGSYTLNLSYFRYPVGLQMTGPKFHRLFGGTPRAVDSRIEPRHMDLAASIQKVCEEVVLRSARHAWERTGRPRNLVLAGGVALNCVANGRVLREGPFENLWVQPASGDAGGALGAALFAWHQLLDQPRNPIGPDAQQASWLGPSYSCEAVKETLDQVGARYRQIEDETELLNQIADHLATRKIVGWFHGRSEFGPRALGARSILGDPRSPEMQSDLNLKIKFREGFRPFAPCVLREHAHAWFEVRPDEDSPYMLLVAPIREEHRLTLSDLDHQTLHDDPDLSRRVRIARSSLPAITHVDYSARIQTVDGRHGRFRRLLEAFHAKTGCPVLVNTSFNLSWEPIVQSPNEAYETFMQSAMDTLVLENCVLLKEEQPLGLDLTYPATAARLDPRPAGARSTSPAGLDWPNLRDFLETMRADPLIRLLGEQLPYDALILEAGCGAGYLTNFLAVAHRTVVGIDEDSRSLATARAFGATHHIRRSAFVQTELSNPALHRGRFDVVIITGGPKAEHAVGREISELVELLRPGGVLLVLAVEPSTEACSWFGRTIGLGFRPSELPGMSALRRVKLKALAEMLSSRGLLDLRLVDHSEESCGGGLFGPGAGEIVTLRGRPWHRLKTIPAGGVYLVAGRRPSQDVASP